MELNYHHLQYFHAVAHHGHLGSVAAACKVSPSVISVAIRKLERDLGRPLFERRGRSLHLTDVGRTVRDYADRIFTTGSELVQALAGQAERQVLRVGALPTLSRNFQLQVLRSLLGRDDVHLVLRSAGLRELLQQLDSHELDLVLATRAVARDHSRDITSHLLLEQPVSLVGLPHPDQGRFRFPQDLHLHPLLLPSAENPLREAFDLILEAAGVQAHIVAEVDDMAMLRLLAQHSGPCLALVPPVVVQGELASGVLVEWYRVPQLHERFYALTRKRHLPHALVQELLASPPASNPGRPLQRSTTKTQAHQHLVRNKPTRGGNMS